MFARPAGNGATNGAPDAADQRLTCPTLAAWSGCCLAKRRASTRFHGQESAGNGKNPCVRSGFVRLVRRASRCLRLMTAWAHGLACSLQTLPFQCSTMVCSSSNQPTAHASDREITVTPSSSLLSCGRPGSALGLSAQVLPFQCSIRVWKVPELPTAHAFDEDNAATPKNSLLVPGLAVD